jgi:hypothetical protein
MLIVMITTILYTQEPRKSHATALIRIAMGLIYVDVCQVPRCALAVLTRTATLLWIVMIATAQVIQPARVAFRQQKIVQMASMMTVTFWSTVLTAIVQLTRHAGQVQKIVKMVLIMMGMERLIVPMPLAQGRPNAPAA